MAQRRRKRQIKAVKTHIKSGDTVYVIAGKEKGLTGKVLKIDRSRGVAMVEKLNIIKRHTKATQANPQGGIVEKEAGIQLSNLLYYDEDEAKPTRLGTRVLSSGEKVRFSKRTDQEIKG